MIQILKYNSIRFLLVVIFSLSVVITSDARHIVGGDITVQLLPNINGDPLMRKYKITINVYRDCWQQGIQNRTPFDEAATIGIHRKNGNNWDYYGERDIVRMFRTGEMIEPNGGACIEIPFGLCVDRNVYEFELDLPVHDDSWLISYQRCCRNETVSNIIDPGAQGIAYTYEITAAAQQQLNNSAVFNNFPPILICAERPFFFDHSATDGDGDQLVYEFCTPLTAGGQNTSQPLSCGGTTPSPANCRPPFELVSFRQPTFSPTNPIPGAVDFRIDPNTGLITGTPSNLGQYVVGICVKEFRNGELIGEVRRDIQLNVSNCGFAAPRIKSDSVIGADRYVINSCGETAVDFINDSDPAFVTDGYYWQFDVDGEIRSGSARDASFTFPGVGSYQGFMVVNPNTDCSDTAFINTNILPGIAADFEFDYDECIAGPVDFNSTSSTTGADFIVSWDWDFGDEGLSDEQNPQYMYSDPGIRDVSLVIKDNNRCIDTIVKSLDYSPVPELIVIEPSSFVGCLPANVFFNNLSEPINESYEISWDFGDGNTSSDISPTHTYETEGIYSVSVSITSPLGCTNKRTYNSWIRVEEKPTADFSFTPPFPNVFNRTVQFVDESTEAISWQWNFNNEASAFEPNPSYTFPDTGFHQIDLVVTHVSGCTDTATQIIDIRPESTFFMPNAFTPNADAKNDEFKGTGYLDGISEFTMTIWSRWGEKIFETDDPTEGWNGRKNNVGAELPNDVYVYLVSYQDPRNNPQKLKGYATLLR